MNSCAHAHFTDCISTSIFMLTSPTYICSADKGKAVVVEDAENYIYKMQQQINEGDYELAKGSEKTLLQKNHQKLVAQLKKMGLMEFKERRPFLVTALVMASMYI